MGKDDRKLPARIKAVKGSLPADRYPANNDKIMYDWIVHQGYDPIIIATKLDKIKRSQKDKCVKAIRTGLQVKPGTKIIPFSAETKQGRDEIWELMDEVIGYEA